MSKEKAKIEGGQTLNELGGDYKKLGGGETSATDKNVGPNASLHALIQRNDISVNAGIGGDANAFQMTGDVADVKAFGVHAGAEGELGLTGVKAELEAGVTLMDAEAKPGGVGIGVKLGLGADTGGSAGLGGVEAKVLGTGFSLGKKTGVSVLGNEFYVDFSKPVSNIRKLFGF